MAEPEKSAAPAPVPASVSFVAWGIFMLVCAVVWAAAASYEGPFLARGCLIFGVASFIAGWANKKGRAVVAWLLVLAGFGGCVVSGGLGVTNSRWFLGKGTGDQTVGHLGALRSALSIYYGDLEGVYPRSLDALTVNGKYLKDIPDAKVPGAHQASSSVLLGKTPDDAGGWLYNNVQGDANVGNVMVNCTHTDYKGSTWVSY